MTAGRTYLSIGDVLTLLRQEFPDVTISKIRFLESQGLVNPERTPSGYRKFYEHDVERLRWVLRQQREHFLPLKVIKGRLEDETSAPEDAASEDSAPGDSAPEDSASLGNGHGSAEPAQKSTAVGSTAKDSEGGARGPSRISAVGIEDREPSADSLLEVPGHLPGFDPAPGDDSIERHLAGETAGQHVSRAAYSPGQGSSSRASQHSRSSQSGPSRPLGNTATEVAARQAGQGRAEADKGSAPTARPGAHEAAVSAAARADGGRQASRPGMLTVAEIAAAAGSTESAIEELESYGILTGRTVGGVVHFDESEITIARVAAEFAKFGIEPRHLRLYKHASEREAGFVEQLVLPLLKQRNPEARKRAEEMVSDLTRLGEGLKAAMVRRSLQDLLGGVTPQARVVHTRADIDAAFVRLGREIEEAFPAGALLVAVQRGSIFVLADLIRRIGVGCEVDFLSVSDYEGGSGRARIVQDLATDVHGRDVVLVEDIVDTGLTCEYVLQTLRGRGPASLAVLALLDRRARRIVPVPLQFVGFEVTDELLIGWGLGVAGRYRNLEVIAAADASVLEGDRDAYVTQFYGDRVEQPATR